MSAKLKIKKRLSYYWKMELANVIIVPAAMIFFAGQAGSPIGWLSLFSIIPMCGLLLVGGLYWRGKHKGLSGDKTVLNTALSAADRLQYPLLILTAIVCLLSIAAFGNPGLARGTGDRVVAAIAALLSALEYVNYYHRQLQHFDHVADFKRLLSGRGFRRAQMAQDLAIWRNTRRDTPG